MDNKQYTKRNFRDLSIYTNEEGYSLKEGFFFRSGKLYKLSKKELKLFNDLQIKTILDFRTPGEQENKPDTVLPGASCHTLPLVESEMFGITHEGKKPARYSRPPNMPSLYRKLVTADIAVNAIKGALQMIFDPNREGPILWHCTEGKDRAGLVTVMFLYALGYSLDTIYEDYQKTNASSKPKGKRYRALIRVFMFNNKLAQGVYQAMLASEEYLDAAIDEINKVYGGLSQFLHDQLGITQEMIGIFKAKYMVKK